ncbi:hypothetical protein GWO72_02300 [Corynebacterium macginleyi]|nr:hypothetical protein [Corynebacterium macginleyi]
MGSLSVFGTYLLAIVLIGDAVLSVKPPKFIMRLPSFSGHPISTDLVSVGEDVHCEFVKEEVHPGVPA